MGTRSTISILKTDGSVESVYCHWDGYPENNGACLLIHYQEADKVKELIGLGSLSSLRKNVKPTSGEHTYDKPQDNVTIAYGRDRQEDDVEAEKYATKEDFQKDGNFQEYDYVFNEKKSKWYLYEPSKEKYSTLVSVVKRVAKGLKGDFADEFPLFLKEQEALKRYGKIQKEVKENKFVSLTKPKL